MKLKSLLVLGASMLMTTSAFADWQDPSLTGSDPVSGKKYYIKNVESGKYMAAMATTHSWATTCGLGEDGQLSTLTYDTAKEGWTIQRSDNKYTFRSGADECHVDMGSQGHNFFTFTKLENGNYTIENNASDDLYSVDVLGEHQYWGYQPEAAVPTHIYCNSLADMEGHFIEWKFVSAEALDLYNSAMKLKSTIEEINKDFPSVDVSEEKAVYDNEESTKEQLDNAVASAGAKLAKAKADKAEKEATLANPIDFTSAIINPTFDKVGDFTGWSGEKFGAGGTTSTCAEQYQKKFDTYQDLVNMPRGVYKVTVDGMYRAGSAAEDYAAEKLGTLNNTKLYGMNLIEDAENRDIALANVFHQFHGIEPGEHFDIAGNSLGGQANTLEGETYYVPNSMKDFTNYNGTTADVDEPYYKGCGVLFPVTEGTLRIGVKNETTLGWSIFDNFGLTYYGNGADAWAAIVDDVKMNNVINPNALVSVSVRSQYESTLIPTTATDYESYKAANATIIAAKALVDENTAAWDAYKALAEKSNIIVLDPKYKDVKEAWALQTGVKKANADIKNLTLSTEEVKKATEDLNTLYSAASDATPPGTDVTDKFIVNGDFANGWTGWEHSGTGGNVAANAAAKCAEAWNSANFDIHQTITTAPVGAYEVQVQGFYRYLRGNNAWLAYYNEDGTKKSDPVEFIKNTPAMIYVNEATAPMSNVFDYQVENGSIYTTTGDLAPYVDPNGTYWYPNDMVAAGQAFDKGAYMVNAFGLVAKKGDPLVIGIKGNSNQGGDSWAIFTRFKLVFQGFKAEVIEPQLEAAKQKLNDALNGEEAFSVDAYEAGSALLEEVEAAIESGDGETMFNVLSKTYSAITAIDESKALFAALNEKATELETAMGTYDETASEEAKEAAGEILGRAQEIATTPGVFTDAEAQEAMDEIDPAIKALAMLVMPEEIAEAIANASDKAPVDITELIINPDFEGVGEEEGAGSTEGWTFASGTGDTGAKATDNDTYKMENSNGSFLFNTWNGSAVEGGFFVKQAMRYYLPEGTYSVKAVVTGDAETELNFVYNDAVKATVKAEDKGKGLPTEVVFKVTDGSAYITIGVTSNNWFKADNFKLYAFGTESAYEEGIIVREDSIKGDVNGDNAVDVKDINAIIAVMAGGTENPKADVNGDNAVDVKDINAVIAIMAGGSAE